MKNYEEMAKCALEARDKYVKKKTASIDGMPAESITESPAATDNRTEEPVDEDPSINSPLCIGKK